MPNGILASHVSFSRILGLRESVALGLSVSVAMLVFSVGGVVLAVGGDSAPWDFILAGVLFLPILLSYAEVGAGRPGSASPYQISRAYGSLSAAFVVGWLMLAGLVAAAALLALGVGERLALALQSLFGVELGLTWSLVIVTSLAALNEWLSEEDRWRSRTMLVWLLLGTVVGVLAWVIANHPPERADLPTMNVDRHDLGVVALLGCGLWFVDLTLNHRRQMQRPDRTLRASLLIVWPTTAVIAAAATSVVMRSPSLLRENWAAKLSWGETRLELLVLLTGLIFCWLGVSRLVSRTVRLSGAMAVHGYLPKVDTGLRFRRARAAGALLALSVVVVVVARVGNIERLAAIAAFSFFVITVFVLAPHALKPSRGLSESRPNRLPLHPLFPGMAIAAGVFFALSLGWHPLLFVLGWLAVGWVYLVLYGRRKSAEAVQEEAVVGDLDEIGEKTSPRVMVAVGDEDHLPRLLSVAATMAETRGAQIMVLKILAVTDDLSLFGAQQAAEREWQNLDQALKDSSWRDLDVKTMVRIAPAVAPGVVSAANEHDVDWVLLGSPRSISVTGASPIVGQVFSGISRPLAVVRGAPVGQRPGIVVATGGGPHSPVALELGRDIAQATAGSVELVSVSPRRGPSGVAAEALAKTLESAELEGEIATRVLEADSIQSGLLDHSGKKDLLILGASVDRLLKQTISGGLAAEIGRARTGTTMVVKRAEAAMRFWQRRLWELLFRLTPTLTVEERTEVYSQMRHSARADVDFFTLISLSSAIAILGLLLDSGAVIIGAMLVAPLMSPILALAQGIVRGNPILIRRASASTFKGMVVAIGVGTLITILLPRIEPTREILARVSPNLLDLGVALAAGAAAAYAVSRASVAAALPGVAISVALVPPLCVVGYGLGSSDFSIAGGALLLFLTNLAAIVLVGAMVFVALGFRPSRAERDVQVRRAALITALAVALLVIPLGMTSWEVTRREAVERKIAATIARYADETFRVEGIAFERVGAGYRVEGLVYAFAGFDSGRIVTFRQRLRREVGVPVELRLTIVPATLAVVDEGGSEGPQLESPVVPSGAD